MLHGVCVHVPKQWKPSESFYPRWAELISDLITLLHSRITDKEAQHNCINRNLTVAGTVWYHKKQTLSNLLCVAH